MWQLSQEWGPSKRRIWVEKIEICWVKIKRMWYLIRELIRSKHRIIKTAMWHQWRRAEFSLRKSMDGTPNPTGSSSKQTQISRPRSTLCKYPTKAINMLISPLGWVWAVPFRRMASRSRNCRIISTKWWFREWTAQLVVVPINTSRVIRTVFRMVIHLNICKDTGRLARMQVSIFRMGLKWARNSMMALKWLAMMRCITTWKTIKIKWIRSYTKTNKCREVEWVWL